MIEIKGAPSATVKRITDELARWMSASDGKLELTTEEIRAAGLEIIESRTRQRVTAARMLEVLRESPSVRANMPDSEDREWLMELVVADLHQAHASIARLQALVDDMLRQGKSIPYFHGG